jgi:uncharacterized protein
LTDPEGGIDAGSFGDWLQSMRAVLRGHAAADVPCGDCVGCCVSSYPIPLRTTDQAALAAVPDEFLHLPNGRAGALARMGYRADGSCPMLAQGRCSIYAARPQTCRDYDCRIYAAAGLLPDGERPVIAARVKAWAFGFASESERQSAAALLAAARFIRTHAADFPASMRAGAATSAAVLAVKVFSLFLAARASAAIDVQQVVDAARAFDERGEG